jgi:ferredoxin
MGSLLLDWGTKKLHITGLFTLRRSSGSASGFARSFRYAPFPQQPSATFWHGCKLAVCLSALPKCHTPPELMRHFFKVQRNIIKTSKMNGVLFTMKELEKLLLSEGANLIGFADLNGITTNKEMPFGISVAVKLSPELIKSIHNGPNMQYYEEYHRINNLLDKIVAKGAEYLIKNGFKAFAQTTTAVAQTADYKTDLPHKTVATRAGLGWIGKCALLVTNEFGSGIRISSFLTNAKLKCGDPIEKSFCGNCMKCAENCPAGAISGKLWNVKTRRSELIDVKKCSEAARKLAMGKIQKEITLCGKCFEVCPYTMKYVNNGLAASREVLNRFA